MTASHTRPRFAGSGWRISVATPRWQMVANGWQICKVAPQCGKTYVPGDMQISAPVRSRCKRVCRCPGRCGHATALAPARACHFNGAVAAIRVVRRKPSPDCSSQIMCSSSLNPFWGLSAAGGEGQRSRRRRPKARRSRGGWRRSRHPSSYVSTFLFLPPKK